MTTTPHPSTIDIQRLPETKEWRLVANQWLPLTPEQLFPFFSDAHNLQQITPQTLSFEILTPAPITMGEGTLIDYKIKIHGVPAKWRTRISTWEPPHRFVDEQLKGPYRKWHHLHEFMAIDDGTLCRDTVHYQVPGGPLSPLIHSLIVKRDVQNIFQYRMRTLDKLFNKCD